LETQNNTTENQSIKLLSFSKKKRYRNEHLNDLIFPDRLCKEIWITNFKILNVKKKSHLFLIIIHCYDGYSMIKFHPKSLKSNPNKFLMRGKDFTNEFGNGEIRKLLRRCGDVIYQYLELFPDNYIGFIGQTDYRDNSGRRKRINSQRFSIYEIFINTYFKRPKYSILNNKRFNDFNLKLIRKVLSKKKAKFITTQQKKNYESFLSHVKQIPKETIFQFMTKETQNKYLNNEA
jgi:hypothetical protein